MRIIVEATGVSAGKGGIVTYFAGLIGGWHEAEFHDDIRIVTARHLPSVVRDSMGCSTTAIEVGGTGLLSKSITQQMRLPVITSKWNADVVLCTTPIAPIGLNGVPIVTTIHDLRHVHNPKEFSRQQNWYRKVMYRLSVHRSRCVITVSETTKREVIRHFRRPSVQVRAIHHGSDHVDHWLRPTNDQGHALTFAHFSNKNPKVAVMTWHRLAQLSKSFDRRLHIAGASRSDRQALRLLASSLGIDRLISVHDYLPDDEYRQLFTSASLVIMPSTLEGFGLPLVEAMRLGIPVVASDDPAIREIGEQGALYASPRSVEQFATQCQSALFDLPLRQRLVDAGHERANVFTWRRAAEETRKVLEEICK